MSVHLQYAPYAPPRRDAGTTAATSSATWPCRTLEDYAPGIGALVTARQVLTPARPRARLRPDRRPPAPRRAGLDSFFLWRPLLGHARYRLPVDGLYLAGSGAHPGGGITGQPGQNAAREILADRKRWAR